MTIFSALTTAVLRQSLWASAVSTEEECLKCSKEAVATARQSCGNATGGKFWMYRCFLRYENFNFVGILNTDETGMANPVMPWDDRDRFSMAVMALFTNLSDEVLLSPFLYSSGQTNASLYHIFGIVQCWRDITSVNNYRTCLSLAIRSMLNATDDGTRLGGWSCKGSCVAHYEISKFVTLAPPAPPLQLPSPPPIQRPPITPSNVHIYVLLI
ncbi:hypothetical protein SUGI_0534710 [Cryptomeria japonica]|nr:hypothetical protein SUGI_0534710 [Cryptomeria japonica]